MRDTSKHGTTARTERASSDSGSTDTARQAAQIAGLIQEERLWDLLMELAQFGATERGGVNRQALSGEDIEAVNHLCRWACERGYEYWIDEIGNFFILRPGADDGLDPLVIGSHLDSQPTGGKFDGVFGVVAALEIFEALDEASMRTRRPLYAVAWMNEEGSRFPIGVMGSGFAVERFDLDDLKRLESNDGVSLADALAVFQSQVNAPFRATLPARYHAYLETHIEQGPMLEERSIPVGIVSGIQGIRRVAVKFLGKAAHSGTTPASQRKDALKAAAQFVTNLEAQTRKEGDALRLTVGKLDVFPNSPNTVPELVSMIVETRHPEESVLAAVSETIHSLARVGSLGCEIGVEELSQTPPSIFDGEIVKTAEAAADELGLAYETMMSGAGHDALNLNRICKTCMIFAPCKDGISHAENEYAAPSDLARATKVLAAVAVKIAI